jgi:hypothetical protein
VDQLDLHGNTVTPTDTPGIPTGIPSKGRLAVMAATGGDLRLLLVILIAMELPTSTILGAVGC